MTGTGRSRPPRRERAQRTLDWTLPPPPVRRELIDLAPDRPVPGRPPVLLVHGAWHGAWCWQERWLPGLAAAGWHGYAVSLRGHGGSQDAPGATLRHYEHDVLQAITTLPSPPVLVGHSLGGLVVQRVLERYRAAPAGVLLAPAPADHAFDSAAAMLRHDPRLVLDAARGRAVRPRATTLFGPAVDPATSAAVAGRLGPTPGRISAQVVLPRRVPDVRAPLLVIGGERDRVVPPHAVARTARRYGTRPVLFRGLGHELMLEPGAGSVLAYVLDWLGSTLRPAEDVG